MTRCHLGMSEFLSLAIFLQSVPGTFVPWHFLELPNE